MLNGNKFNWLGSFLLSGIVIFMISVFYFSWLSSPQLANSGLLPEWLILWADAPENENLRTAIPFVFLGIISGTVLLQKSKSFKKWINCWLLLLALVLVAELGQLFLPLRSFDIEDIGWGALGSAFGLVITFVLSRTNLKKIKM